MYQAEKQTERVARLREYYLTHSKMSIDKNIACWKCHRSLMLYIEGWMKSGFETDTAQMRRSASEAYMLAHTKPVIIEGELIVGQPNFEDFTQEEEKRYKHYAEYEQIMPIARGRADHTALDYTLLLERGIVGIIELLDDEIDGLDLTDGGVIERYEFLSCCKTELGGLLALANAYAEQAKTMAEESEGAQKAEYLALWKVLRQVPAHPARTFREALQSIHMFTWSLYGIYSFGKPDVYLYPYYKRDIEEGVMTREEAQELIDCFFLLSVPNMSSWAAEGLMLGGRDENGSRVENELTFHFLTAIAHTHLPDPNVGFCVTRETSEEALHYAARMIADGHCQPQIWNSDEVTRALKSYGFDDKASNMFTLSTCVEITPIGCSGISITSPYMNALQVFLDALSEVRDDADFEELFDAFRKKFADYSKRVMLKEHLWQLERGRNGTDPVRISVLINDCLAKGKSSDRGGARYNHIEPNVLGMQNVTESLNVIRCLVYDEKVVTLGELKKALAANYEGYEALLLRIRNKVSHFGTGDERANKLAKRVADAVLAAFEGMRTVRSARVIPGAFSYREHDWQGSRTGASPDGRLRSMPLNDGSNPVQGYDDKGPTLSLLSTAYWEPSRFIGGTSVNVKISSGVQPEKIVSLIKGYIGTHGTQMQFNIIDTETLRDAQAHPEWHRDLLVRIGGYSDFFVTLPRRLQDEIISRTVNEGI